MNREAASNILCVLVSPIQWENKNQDMEMGIIRVFAIKRLKIILKKQKNIFEDKGKTKL